MLILYIFLFFLYFIFSFSQTDPNIVYFQNKFFLNFQQYMWNLGQQQRNINTLIYFLLISSIIILYLFIINKINKGNFDLKKIKTALVSSIIILILSNPALSHDIFNYIFNARMVVDHQANPHIMTAWDFPKDSWTRFVQNAHSPAPYGYGWTAMSLIPYMLGLKRLKTVMLSFKFVVGFFFYAILYFQEKISKIFKIKNADKLIFTFALNPLVLIETFSNGHNDTVMMGLLLGSIYYFYLFVKKKDYLKIIIPIILFIVSVSIKFASITSLGGSFWWFISQNIGPKLSFGFTNAIAHFSPLLTLRSQRFLPWYLIWSLSFLPLIKEKWARSLLIAFSFSSLLSYIPRLYYPIFDSGSFEEIISLQRQQITFLGASLFFGIYLFYSFIKKKFSKK